MKRVYTPGPGEYDSYIKPFGSNMGNVGFGSKIKAKLDNGVPPIGVYDHMKSFNKTKPRVLGAKLEENLVKPKNRQYRLNTDSMMMFEPEIDNEDLPDRIVRRNKHNFNKSQPPKEAYQQ